MEYSYTLDQIGKGETVLLDRISSHCRIKRRLREIGLTENTVIQCVGCSPLGDPMAFLIRGAVIAIRKEDCRDILIKSEGENTPWD